MNYRDHYPATDETRPTMRDAYVCTKNLYTDLFGEPDKMLWPDADRTCGDSYSGLIEPRACPSIK